MTRQTTKGKCLFCSEEFSGSVIGRHLQTCKEKTNHSEKYGTETADNYNTIFLVKVFSSERPEYWLFIEARGTATLKQLDTFLRNIWLECCGHLSQFIINNIHYESQTPDEPNNEFASGALKKMFPDLDIPEIKNTDMKHRLIDILTPTLTFRYEYDFGTTSELVLKVIESRQGELKKAVRLAARNEPPVFACTVCGKQAKEVCAQCIWERDALFCDNCIKKHSCGEDMALPIVNSPRSGLCGYSGNDEE